MIEKTDMMVCYCDMNNISVEHFNVVRCIIYHAIIDVVGLWISHSNTHFHYAMH